MKKILSIVVLVVTVIAFIPAVAYAETYNLNLNQNTSRNVATNAIVGNVEAPVYEVEIDWYNFVFDWRYDQGTQKYNWANHTACSDILYWDDLEYSSIRAFYSDSSCETYVDDSELISGHYYYAYLSEDAMIDVFDGSTGGYVEVATLWNPASNYSYTNGQFYYLDMDYCSLVTEDDWDEALRAGFALYKNSNCTGTVYNPEEETFQENTYYTDVKAVYVPYEGSSVPERARHCGLGEEINGVVYCDDHIVNLKFMPVVDYSKTVTTPTIGETIGSVTLVLTTH